MPRREATPAPAEQAAAAPEPDVDLSQVARDRRRDRPARQPDRPAAAHPGRLRLPAGAGGRRDRPAQRRPRLAHLRHHHVLRAVHHRPHRPAQVPRVPRHGLPRGRRHAHHRGPGAGARVADGETRADLEFTPGLGGLHGRLLAGARHAHRRRDLRQPQRRRDAQDRAQAARAGRGGTREAAPMPEAAVPAEGVKVEVSAARRRPPPGDGLRRHRLRVRRLPEDPRRVRRRDRRGRPAGPGRGQHHRLSRPLLAGTAGGRVATATRTTRASRSRTSRRSSRSTSPAGRWSRSCCTSTRPRASASPAPTTSRSTRPSRRASPCATSASSTPRASTSTWRAAATRPRARRSRR